MNTAITSAALTEMNRAFCSDKALRIARNAVTQNGVNAAARNPEALQHARHEFSLQLEQGSITNQKKSGRCWMFAALNCLRFPMIQRLKLEDFELSQNYTLFYDKLEKSNYFLENILKTLEEPTDSRLISYLLSAPVQDGGQWDMLRNLVKKYGLVPKSAMPETAVSSNTGELNFYLTEKLREFACKLRAEHKNGVSGDALRAQKAEMLQTVYNMLCVCLGCPPETFTLELRSKDGEFIRECGLTPQSFYEKYIGIDLDDYVSVINAPTENKPLHRSFTVRFLGNVEEGKTIRYVNLPSESLKRAAIAQMKDGAPVWFGCDVGKCYVRDEGILDLSVYEPGSLFGTDFPMTKSERLDYGQSLLTHAMVFEGVNLDEKGKPNRWRVENSWGKDVGHDGYFVMSDAWFDEYLYQVVVNRKYLTVEELAEYESEPITLEPWDPMGSLAL